MSTHTFDPIRVLRYRLRKRQAIRARMRLAAAVGLLLVGAALAVIAMQGGAQ